MNNADLDSIRRSRVFEVMESVRFVARESRLVRLNQEAAASFARELASSRTRPPAWDASYHLGGAPERVAAYLLVLDTINFCFWPPPGAQRWGVIYDGRTVSGYNGLALALKLAVERGEPLTDPAFLRDLSPEALNGILGGAGTLQLLEERAWALRELGEVLENDYGGEAARLVGSVKGWAVSLARLLAKKLQSFRDVAVYRERGIFFYKRAQIFAADLFNALGGWGGLGAFRDMENLTAFA
ncbi:MAG: queuosine salvage family protein, partial [Desulfobacteraceae bacterium]